jgi:hypothetical protein
MTYTVNGTIGPDTHTVTWTDGELSGDAPAVERIHARAEELEGELVGPPTGPFTEVDHLQDGLSALFIMDEVFDAITEATGDVPEAPEVPEGAVA